MLRHYLNKNGLVARVHGNTSRLPQHALTLQDVQQVVGFITNFAEDHAIMLPGRIPGYKRYDLQLLLCSTTRLMFGRLISLPLPASTLLTPLFVVCGDNFCHRFFQPGPEQTSVKSATRVLQCSAILISRSSNLSEADKTQVFTLTTSYNIIDSILTCTGSQVI